MRWGVACRYNISVAGERGTLMLPADGEAACAIGSAVSSSTTTRDNSFRTATKFICRRRRSICWPCSSPTRLARSPRRNCSSGYGRRRSSRRRTSPLSQPRSVVRSATPLRTPRSLGTVYGFGYRFVGEVTADVSATSREHARDRSCLRRRNSDRLPRHIAAPLEDCRHAWRGDPGGSWQQERDSSERTSDYDTLPPFRWE